MDAQEALRRFDTQLRRLDGEQVGPVVRNAGSAGNWIVHSELTTENADAVIAEQQAYFASVGGRFEWKHYGYDDPADLPARLVRAGFVAEPTETLMVAEIADLLDALAGTTAPDGVRLVPITDEAGFAAIVALQSAVWGGSWHSLGSGLAAEHAADPCAIEVVGAFAGEELVCAAWVRFHPGTDFASLWGGSTLPAWRHRGIYRSVVAHRARIAADRGFRYLQVDASDDSAPILGRLGFARLTSTTPFVWSPPN
jgi:hypothetical protein